MIDRGYDDFGVGGEGEGEGLGEVGEELGCGRTDHFMLLVSSRAEGGR